MSNLFIAAALTYCFIVITLAPALSTASLQCDIQNLAPVIGHHCRLSDRPNIVCCDALVDAMDGIGGGGPCVCLISTHPAVKLSFNMLLRMYISCGGLRPGIVGQLANSCPAGLLRPSPPPPPAATLPSPPPPPPATLSPSSPPPPPPPATSSPSPPPPPALPQSTCSSYSATKEGTTCSKKIDISMMASAELDTTEWDIMSHPYSKTFIQWGADGWRDGWWLYSCLVS